MDDAGDDDDGGGSSGITCSKSSSPLYKPLSPLTFNQGCGVERYKV